MIYYTTKSLILLENRLVIVTEDGIFLWCFVKLQHCRTLPIPVMFNNVKSCLKLLSLPFSLFSCLSDSRPSSNSQYHELFCINSCTSLKPCSAITPVILQNSSEKILFTVGCFFCITVQLVVILLNLTVISIFDCLI